MRDLFTACAVLAFLALAVGAQATLHVPDDYPTIRDAVSAASDGDTVLVANGTYSEREIRLWGKRITIDGSGSTLDLARTGRAFLFVDGEGRGTILTNFVIRSGLAQFVFASPGYLDGGAVLIEGSSPTIRDVEFIDCWAGRAPDGGAPGHTGGHGGALYVEDGSPLVERCTFIDNRAGAGGVGDAGSTGRRGTLFQAPGSGQDGARGGQGGHGGAVFLTGGSPVLSNCTFQENTAGAAGNGGAGGDGGDAGSWVGLGGPGGDGGASGRGGDGGAIFVAAGHPRILGCVFDGNEGGLARRGGYGGGYGFSLLGVPASWGETGAPGAGGDGGGLNHFGGNTWVEGGLFIGNRAGRGGYGIAGTDHCGDPCWGHDGQDGGPAARGPFTIPPVAMVAMAGTAETAATAGPASSPGESSRCGTAPWSATSEALREREAMAKTGGASRPEVPQRMDKMDPAVPRVRGLESSVDRKSSGLRWWSTRSSGTKPGSRSHRASS